MDIGSSFSFTKLIISGTSFLLISSIIIIITLYFLGVFDTPNVNCQQTEWSSCDPNTGKKTRRTLIEQSGSGKKCGALEENCAVNCKLSEWSSCDPATKKRTRTVITEAKNGGEACGALEESCIIPFEATSIASTAPQERLNIFYLDRHPKLCNDKPLNSFSFNKDDEGYKYNYKCVNNFEIESKTDKTTPLADENNNNYLYNIVCAAGEALSNYGFTRNPDKYEYTCLKSKEPISQEKCRVISKPFDKNLSFEDNHNFTCDNDEFMNGIQLVNNTTLDYTCCKK